MVPNCATAEDVLKAIKDEKVQMIDLRFTDLPGMWQHFSVPPSAVNIDSLSEGIGFDGSSIRGFQEIQESDMLVVPDPTTAFLDPFVPTTTLVLTCNIRDPMTGQSYSRDPRHIAQTAAAEHCDLEQWSFSACAKACVELRPFRVTRKLHRVFLTYIFLGALEGGPTWGRGPVQYPGGATVFIAAIQE
jgi:hypothetical protein